MELRAPREVRRARLTKTEGVYQQGHVHALPVPTSPNVCIATIVPRTPSRSARLQATVFSVGMHVETDDADVSQACGPAPRPQAGTVTDVAGDKLTDRDHPDTLRTENRKLRTTVKHLTDELQDAHERIAFLASELGRVRAMVPSRGSRTS